MSGSDVASEGPEVAAQEPPSGPTVYVVTGTTGEYSDRTEWLVRVHATEAAAQADVEWLTGKLTALGGGSARSFDYDGRHRLEAHMAKYDPGFCVDYTGTKWFVQPAIYIADGAPTRQDEAPAKPSGMPK